MDHPDIATTHDPWMLAEGDYVIVIGLFRRGSKGMETVKRRESDISVHSKRDARYYFGQYTDLARRIGKLARAAGRLF